MSRVLHMLHPLDVDPGHAASTVRKGIKWKGAVGAELILCVCSDRCLTAECSFPDFDPCDNCDRQGMGIAIGEWFGQFRNIPARVIEHEHEERSRLYSGLLQSMRKAYGSSFNDQSTVTVLIYDRLS